jgi:lipoprotein-releasing system ATP-binding protein
MPFLTASNLHKTYTLHRKPVPVLRGVSLSLEKGSCVAVVGKSGSGKSTLLHLLGGLDRPDRISAHGRGAITVDGQDVTGLRAGALDRYRARTVGFVFQLYHLLPELTVLQNVTIAAMVRHGLGYAQVDRDTQARARALLDSFELGHRLDHRPAELSGGERQRVALARALINTPPLILADEPTGNLDPATGGQILDLLGAYRARHQATMLIVTHSMDVAARADRVLHLVGGQMAPDPGAPATAATGAHA